MVRGEIPIELGASWFSPKCVEAQQLSKFNLFRPSGLIYYQVWDEKSVLEIEQWESLGVKHCFGAGCENGTKS